MSNHPFEFAKESELPSPGEIREALSQLDALVRAKAGEAAIRTAIANIPFANMQLLRLGVTQLNTVYRATRPRHGMDDTLVSSFGMPPIDVVNRGRANLEGHPVFYCALLEDTAIQEVLHRVPITRTGHLLYMSRWKPCKPPNIKQLLYPNSIVHGEVSRAFVDSVSEAWGNVSSVYSKTRSGALNVLCRKMGSYFLDADESYPVSALIGHAALYDFTPPAGYHVDMLAYPSIAKGHEGVNLAVSPRFTEHLELEEVRKYRVESFDQTGSNVTLIAIGKPDGSKIHWNRIKLPVDLYERVEARMEAFPDEGLGYRSESIRVGDVDMSLSGLLEGAWEHFGPWLKQEVCRSLLGDLVDETERHLTLTSHLPKGPFQYEGRQLQQVKIHLTVKHRWGLVPISSAMELT